MNSNSTHHAWPDLFDLELAVIVSQGEYEMALAAVELAAAIDAVPLDDENINERFRELWHATKDIFSAGHTDLVRWRLHLAAQQRVATTFGEGDQ